MDTSYQIMVRALPPEDGGGYLAWVPDLPGWMATPKPKPSTTPWVPSRNGSRKLSRLVAPFLHRAD
jgi:hypothetical protein